MADIEIHGMPPSTFTRTVRLACHEKGIDYEPVPAEMAAKYLDKTRDVVPIFDRQLGRSRSLAGGSVTAADLFLAPVLFYFPDLAELGAIGAAAPNCVRWAREMGARSSVKATDPEMRPHSQPDGGHPNDGQSA